MRYLSLISGESENSAGGRLNSHCWDDVRVMENPPAIELKEDTLLCDSRAFGRCLKGELDFRRQEGGTKMAIGIVHFEVLEYSGKQNCLIRVVVSDTILHDVLHRFVASGVAD